MSLFLEETTLCLKCFITLNFEVCLKVYVRFQTHLSQSSFLPFPQQHQWQIRYNHVMYSPASTLHMSLKCLFLLVFFMGKPSDDFQMHSCDLWPVV